ncbi:hypothetical protein pipiens_011354, partial [Culex pipiens pipiens]
AREALRFSTFHLPSLFNKI